MKPTKQMKPTQEDISTFAYYIWKKEGCPHGRDMEHWLQAETLLLSNWVACSALKRNPAKIQIMADVPQKEISKKNKKIFPSKFGVFKGTEKLQPSMG